MLDNPYHIIMSLDFLLSITVIGPVIWGLRKIFSEEFQILRHSKPPKTQSLGNLDAILDYNNSVLVCGRNLDCIIEHIQEQAELVKPFFCIHWQVHIAHEVQISGNFEFRRRHSNGVQTWVYVLGMYISDTCNLGRRRKILWYVWLLLSWSEIIINFWVLQSTTKVVPDCQHPKSILNKTNTVSTKYKKLLRMEWPVMILTTQLQMLADICLELIVLGLLIAVRKLVHTTTEIVSLERCSSMVVLK